MLNKLTPEAATTLLDSCPLALLLTDSDGRMHGFNAAFTDLLGEAATGLARTADDIRNDGLLAPLLGPDTLINWITPDGAEHWLMVQTMAVDGMTARFYQDVTEKIRLKKQRDACAAELREQSLRDASLGSLLSRHGILVSLEPLVARSRRYNSPLSVVVMGPHPEPLHDQLHVKLSYVLKDQTRWADLVGTNEQRDFILILQETTQDAALQMVEKISGYLDDLGAGQAGALTACYGVTSCQKNDDAESLLERAEGALKEARSNHCGTTIAV
jgi:hypothetical protein